MISALIRIKRIEKKKNNKDRVIINSGVNIDSSIDGEENFDILAGWCKVFHQSTDHFIIGKFTIPITANIEAYLSPFVRSSYD